MTYISKRWTDKMQLDCHYVPDEIFDDMVQVYNLHPRELYSTKDTHFRATTMSIGELDITFYTGISPKIKD